MERIPKPGKVNGKPKGKKGKPPSAAEKRFMKDLTEAFKSVEDHFSGKKKLRLAKDLLNEL